MTRLLLSILLFLLVWPVAAQQPSTPQTNKEDDRIYDQVREKLVSDQDVRGGGIEVIVKNGAVTLRGSVRTDKGKEKAGKLAKKVKGVVSVDNQLQVTGT